MEIFTISLLAWSVAATALAAWFKIRLRSFRRRLASGDDLFVEIDGDRYFVARIPHGAED